MIIVFFFRVVRLNYSKFIFTIDSIIEIKIYSMRDSGHNAVDFGTTRTNAIEIGLSIIGYW